MVMTTSVCHYIPDFFIETALLLSVLVPLLLLENNSPSAVGKLLESYHVILPNKFRSDSPIYWWRSLVRYSV